MELEEGLNFRVHNLIKIIVQTKTNITAKCEGTHWHCDHLQQTELKASSYDQVQSLNIITEDDALNFLFSSANTCPFVDFVVLPPGHGRSVTDF